MNIKKQKLRWKVIEHKSPLNKLHNANFQVKEDDTNAFPVCSLICSTSDTQSDALLIKQRRYAHLIAVAPELLEALISSTNLLRAVDNYTEQSEKNLELINRLTKI